MSLRKVQVNHEKIEPIVTTEPPLEKVQGAGVVPKLYGTTFMFATKGSGKTTALWHILKACANKDTHNYFVNTIYSDPSWDYITDQLDKKKIGYTLNDTTEALREIIAGLDAENKDKKKGDKEPAPVQTPANPFGGVIGPMTPSLLAKWIAIKREKKKRRKIAPKFMFIFDDVSEELKETSIKRFIKQHRHYKSKVIISAYDLKDFPPSLRRNMDQWLIFRGQSLERLKSIHESITPHSTQDLYRNLQQRN